MMKTTITREYDDGGRLIRETTVYDRHFDVSPKPETPPSPIAVEAARYLAQFRAPA